MPTQRHGASGRNEFGKDFGLIHEMVVTGRKVGAGPEFYAALAHDEQLFRETVEFVRQGGVNERMLAAMCGIEPWMLEL